MGESGLRRRGPNLTRRSPLLAQGLIAISYAARAHGITRHEDVDAAKKKCPDLVCVHVATYAEGAQQAEYNEDPKPQTHKVSLDPYRRESRKVVAIFNEMCPLGAIEKASIDEMYCDLTLAVRQLILQRFPHLAKPPPDSPDGLDTPLPEPPTIDWTDLGHRMPTQEVTEPDEGEAAPLVEPPAIEQAATWTDYALACGAELIYKVRSSVRDRLGYTMSAGIAPNKTLAKLCASERKPNGQTTMPTAAIPIYLKNLPFQKIRFLGGKLGDAIASEWASSTVGDLWSVSLADMQKKFGDESRWVWDVLRGIDHSAVIERTKNKTMLASKNVSKPPIRTTQEALRWLSILALELCVRLREAREESPNLWPSTLVLRFLKPGETARSRQTNFPFVKDLQPAHILAAAEKLWAEALGEQSVAQNLEVITIALGFSGLEAGEQGQRSIENFFGGGRAGGSASVVASGSKRPAEVEPEAEAAAVASPSEAKAGPSTSSTSPPPNTGGASGSTPTQARKAKKVKPNGLVSLFQKAAASQMQASQSPSAWLADEQARDVLRATSSEAQASPGPSRDGTARADASAESSHGVHSSPDPGGGSTSEPPAAAPPPPSWVCPQCSKRILPLPRRDAPGGEGEEEGDDAERRLQLARQDHEDFHFAMDLQREDGRALMPGGSQMPPSSQRGPPSSQKGTQSTQRSGSKGGAKKNARPPVQDFFKKREKG